MKRNRNKIRMTTAERVYQVILWIILTIVIIVCIVPFIYVVGMSFTSQGELIERNYFVLIPMRPTVAAYKHVFGQQNFWSGMGITIARTALGIFAALFLTVPAGYILSKSNLPFRRGVMIFFIITMILSGGLIPSYLLMSKLKLINSFWVFIVPAFSNTFGILVVKLFIEGIPEDIIESADLDGATEMQKMVYIAIPLLVPTLCALGLFAAVAHWNSWFDAMVYINDSSKFPIQLIIRNLLISSTAGDLMTDNISTFQQMTPESMKMASVIIAVLPILCVYPFLQKYFIYGMYTGSVKG